MNETLDLQATVASSRDAAMLRLHLDQLTGQPVFKLRFTYPYELRLHFGEPVAYTLPRFGLRFEGTLILGLRCSGWAVRAADGRSAWIAPDSDVIHASWGGVLSKAEFEQANFITPGDRVASAAPTDASPGRFGLALAFESGAALTVDPDLAPDDGEVKPLADWELFLPDDRLLRAFPGYWSSVSSREPGPKAG